MWMDERKSAAIVRRQGRLASRKAELVSKLRAVHISGGSGRTTKMGERGRRERAWNERVKSTEEEKARRSGVASADRSGTSGDAVTRRSFRFASPALSSLVPHDSACLLSLLLFCLNDPLGGDSDCVTASCLPSQG
jgi:hypothetical protein